MTHNRYAITGAAAIAIAVTLSLTGCFGNPLENLVKGGIEGVIEDATGVGIDAGGNTIPKDFPTQIPLPPGDVVTGGSLTVDGKKTWAVTMTVPGSDVFPTLQGQLVGAGFEETFAAAGTESMGMYEGHGYSVILTVSATSGKTEVNYVVSQASINR